MKLSKIWRTSAFLFMLASTSAAQTDAIANIVVIDGQPDQDIRNTRNVVAVIKEGTILDRARFRFDSRSDPGYRTAGNFSMPEDPQ